MQNSLKKKGPQQRYKIVDNFYFVLSGFVHFSQKYYIDNSFQDTWLKSILK